MGNLSGLSVVLTLSLIAILSMEYIKDKFEVIENYGDVPHTFQSSGPTQEEPVAMPTQSLSSQPSHGIAPFGTGDSFRGPYISPDATANGYNMTPQSFEVYQAQVAASTPTIENLANVGSETIGLPGPGTFGGSNYAVANVNSGRANNLSLCSQNYNTFGISTLGQPGGGGLASSLLPSPNQDNFEGFSDCSTQNLLTSQSFLSPSGAMGTNTTSGSLRNANQSLRSEPPNPMRYVGPWNTSDIYPDLLRRPLEGCGPSFGEYGTGANSVGNPTPIGSGL